LRTFVAIELNERTRNALLDAQQALRVAAGGVRWVRPNALHLTLKFIGELREPDLPLAVRSLEEATRQAGPFTMELTELSSFPSRGAPRVIHVRVQELTGELERLHDAVNRALADNLGIAPEKRRYIPHVTLGRVKELGAYPGLEGLKSAGRSEGFGAVNVHSIVLMKSDLSPGGAVYSVIHRFPLEQRK